MLLIGQEAGRAAAHPYSVHVFSFYARILQGASSCLDQQIVDRREVAHLSRFLVLLHQAAESRIVRSDDADAAHGRSFPVSDTNPDRIPTKQAGSSTIGEWPTSSSICRRAFGKAPRVSRAMA